MDKLTELHSQLRLAAGVLDGAASLVRDAHLEPTGVHIYKLGEMLASIFEIQRAIEELRPELATIYEPASEETSAANRRLGPVLLAAYDFESQAQSDEAIRMLEDFAQRESSELHRGIALRELERLRDSDAT
ncbi:MAG: hypothetical protein V4627_07575 [Pseudomonadota bacterium]